MLCLGFGLEISWYQKQLPCIKAHQEPEKKHNNNYNKDFFKDLSNYSCKADWIFELKIENGLCYIQLLISLLLLLLLGFPNFRSISFAKISFSQWKCERKLKLFQIFSSDSFEIFAKFVQNFSVIRSKSLRNSWNYLEWKWKNFDFCCAKNERKYRKNKKCSWKFQRKP